MAYTVPQFPLLMDIWQCAFPDDAAAAYTEVPCAVYSNPRRFQSAYVTNAGEYYFGWLDKPYVTVRFGRVAPFNNNWFTDWSISCVAAPRDCPFYLRVAWGEVMHQGFPNCYNVLYCLPCDSSGAGLKAPMYDRQPGSLADPCS